MRIPIDEPYIGAKSLLLQLVADGSRCRSVYHEAYAFSSVVGFESDLATLEAMYTSLLVQAQASLRRAAKLAPPGARVRGRSYRSSFLIGFALRIGQRLSEIDENVCHEGNVAAGGSLLPVLLERDAAVDAAVHQRFESVKSSQLGGGTDPLGRYDGVQAANDAELAKKVSSGGVRPG